MRVNDAAGSQAMLERALVESDLDAVLNIRGFLAFLTREKPLSKAGTADGKRRVLLRFLVWGEGCSAALRDETQS